MFLLLPNEYEYTVGDERILRGDFGQDALVRRLITPSESSSRSVQQLTLEPANGTACAFFALCADRETTHRAHPSAKSADPSTTKIRPFRPHTTKRAHLRGYPSHQIFLPFPPLPPLPTTSTLTTNPPSLCWQGPKARSRRDLDE